MKSCISMNMAMNIWPLSKTGKLNDRPRQHWAARRDLETAIILSPKSCFMRVCLITTFSVLGIGAEANMSIPDCSFKSSSALFISYPQVFVVPS